MKKLDRRIVKTRKALAEALFGLAQENDYDSITIRDLTGRADIGYSTFFRHYKDKDDLLKQCMTAMREDIARGIKPWMTPYEKALAMFQTVRRHKRAVILGASLPRDHPGMAALWDEATAHLTSVYEARDEPSLPLEVSVNHIIDSATSLSVWWLTEGQDYSPDQMAVMMAELIIKATEQAALDRR